MTEQINRRQKILLVLGASSDIGCALIRRAAGRYDKILAHYSHENQMLDQLKSELGDKLACIRADFSDRESVERMIDEIKDKGLAPGHIVHFAAPRCRNARFAKTDWDEFQAGFTVSVESAVRVLKAFLPVMAKQRYGKVVFMLTSYVQNIPPKYLSSYVTVKYALLGLMKALAAEYAEKGITVNGVSPEMMETKFLSDIPELVVEQNAAASPLGRNLKVEDVVPAFLYLLSDEADCVTGQNLAVTGGK